MANDLITRLLLDSKQFDNNITKATKEVQEFQKKTANISKAVGNSFNSIIGVAGKIAPALGVAMGGYEAFNKVVQSSESNIDAWERSCAVAKTSVDAFFIALNTGSFSNFLSGLNNIVKSAKDAYNAIDDLGTAIAFQDVEIAKLESRKIKLELDIKEGRGGEEELKKVNEDILNLATERAAKAEEAFKSNIKSVIVSETGGWYDENLAAYWSDWNNFKTLSADGLTKENRELQNRRKALGSQYDLVVANYAKYRKMIDDGTASDKVIQSVALVDATREYEVKKAIVNQESKIVEAKQYQITAAKAMQSSYQSQLSTLRYIKSNEEKITKETGKQAANAKNFISNLNRGWNININGNNLLDKEMVDLLRDMPEDIVTPLAAAFEKFKAAQDYNNDLLRQGTINQDQYDSTMSNAAKELMNSTNKVAESAYLVQGKKNITEQLTPKLSTIIGTLSILARNGDDKALPKVEPEAYIRATKELAKSVQRVLPMDGDSASETGLKLDNAKSVRSELLKARDTYRRLIENGSSYDWGENAAENFEKVSTALESCNNLILILDDSIGTLDSKYQKLSFIDNLNSGLGLVTQSISTFNNSFVQSMANILRAIIPVISAVGALAIAEGSEKAVKSSKNWIEAIAAVVALTGTVVTAIQSGKNRTKYANGGIIGGGSYSGDSNLVRVNAGEMILNGSQQANLFRMLNAPDYKQSSSNGQVEFKIRGNELVGVLKNYNTKHSKLI